MTAIPIINIIIGESYQEIVDTLALDPKWERVSQNWYQHSETGNWKIVTRTEGFRGLRIRNVMRIGKVSTDMERALRERPRYV